MADGKGDWDPSDDAILIVPDSLADNLLLHAVFGGQHPLVDVFDTYERLMQGNFWATVHSKLSTFNILNEGLT